MATLLRLVIAAAVVNAAVRAGMVAWDYFMLKDEVQQLVLFGAGEEPESLKKEILAKAGERGVPLKPGNLEVRRTGMRTVATATYAQPVELLPRFTYVANLSFQVEAVSMGGLPPPEPPASPK